MRAFARYPVCRYTGERKPISPGSRQGVQEEEKKKNPKHFWSRQYPSMGYRVFFRGGRWSSWGAPGPTSGALISYYFITRVLITDELWFPLREYYCTAQWSYYNSVVQRTTIHTYVCIVSYRFSRLANWCRCRRSKGKPAEEYSKNVSNSLPARNSILLFLLYPLSNPPPGYMLCTPEELLNDVFSHSPF